MEKIYKLLVLFFGLTVMNLTVQAQLKPYSINLLATNLFTKGSIANFNPQITSDHTRDAKISFPKTKQVTDFTNYPNPALTYTTVDYTLTKKSNVVLKVIDLAGKQLAVLVKQEQSAGRKEFYWELAKNNITSGMYILLLQVESKTYSRKIIVQ